MGILPDKKSGDTITKEELNALSDMGVEISNIMFSGSGEGVMDAPPVPSRKFTQRVYKVAQTPSSRGNDTGLYVLYKRFYDSTQDRQIFRWVDDENIEYYMSSKNLAILPQVGDIVIAFLDREAGTNVISSFNLRAVDTDILNEEAFSLFARPDLCCKESSNIRDGIIEVGDLKFPNIYEVYVPGMGTTFLHYDEDLSKWMSDPEDEELEEELGESKIYLRTQCETGTDLYKASLEITGTDKGEAVLTIEKSPKNSVEALCCPEEEDGIRIVYDNCKKISPLFGFSLIPQVESYQAKGCITGDLACSICVQPLIETIEVEEIPDAPGAYCEDCTGGISFPKNWIVKNQGWDGYLSGRKRPYSQPPGFRLAAKDEDRGADINRDVPIELSQGDINGDFFIGNPNCSWGGRLNFATGLNIGFAGPNPAGPPINAYVHFSISVHISTIADGQNLNAFLEQCHVDFFVSVYGPTTNVLRQDFKARFGIFRKRYSFEHVDGQELSEVRAQVESVMRSPQTLTRDCIETSPDPENLCPPFGEIYEQVPDPNNPLTDIIQLTTIGAIPDKIVVVPNG